MHPSTHPSTHPPLVFILGCDHYNLNFLGFDHYNLNLVTFRPAVWELDVRWRLKFSIDSSDILRWANTIIDWCAAIIFHLQHIYLK